MKHTLRLLCLAPYPVENAAVRYRILQFFPHLAKDGIEPAFRPFMSSAFFKKFYDPGQVLSKALRLAGYALRRGLDIKHAAGYDAVLIHREAAIAGPPLYETLLARALNKPIVFDFDDAIHILDLSPAHRSFAGYLKWPQKTPKTIGMSRAVVAGNRHLAEYAATLNARVKVIPTVVDATQVYPSVTECQVNSGKDRPVVLGWIGTHTTYPYLESLFPVIQEIAARAPVILRIVGAGQEISVPGVVVDNQAWSLASELELLRSFDIGLYPILEDPWSRGKSGFKAIQYMAVGIPAVCAPVGATCDIVQDGVHGFLPASSEQWVEKLELLIRDHELRQSLGKAGRNRIEDCLCLNRQAPHLCDVIWQAVNSRQ